MALVSQEITAQLKQRGYGRFRVCRNLFIALDTSVLAGFMSV